MFEASSTKCLIPCSRHTSCAVRHGIQSVPATYACGRPARVGRAVASACMAVSLVLTALAGRATAGDLAATRAEGPLRVLILCGGADHGSRTNSPVLKRILTGTGRFDVRICESPAGLTSRTLADFDLLVDDHAGPSLGRATEDAIAGFVEAGKGLVITHGALASSKGIPMSDDKKPPARVAPRYWPAVLADEPESTVLFLEVKIATTEHPIVRGMTSGFRTADTALGVVGTPGALVIATARGGPNSGEGGKDVPVVITSNLGNGRIVCVALGHDAAAMHEREFMATFARASEWAASGVVTLPPDLDSARPSDRHCESSAGHRRSRSRGSVLHDLRRVQGPGLDAGCHEHHRFQDRPAR